MENEEAGCFLSPRTADGDFFFPFIYCSTVPRDVARVGIVTEDKQGVQTKFVCLPQSCLDVTSSDRAREQNGDIDANAT